MSLQHSEYLFGLILVLGLVFLFYLLIGWKKRVRARMGDPLLIQQLTRNHSAFRFGIKASLAMGSLAILLVGASNPRKKGASSQISRAGLDVMLILDVSKSMLAEDIRPSRLMKAKQFLIELLDKLENDRVGLILFAGRAYMQMPLTIDHAAARTYIQNAGPDVVPTQGTVIADALRMAGGSFNAKEHKYKAIVLISDGEDHDPEALKVAKQLADGGEVINTLGIGSPEGSTIIDPVTRESKKDANGQVVISKLNETELMQLSDAGNGVYIRLDNVDDALTTLSQRLANIEKRSVTDNEYASYKNYFQWFLGLAFLLLLVEYFLSERKLTWG